MFSSLYRNTLLRPFEAVKGRRTFRYWQELEHTQWHSVAALRDLQFSRLRALIAHAFDHCAFYRERWECAGLDPIRLREIEDLRLWPLIQRSDIATHLPQMLSVNPGSRVISKTTGGSTGEPLRFAISMESYERRTAATYRGYGWAGASPGTKQLYLWGVPLGHRTGRQVTKEYLWERLNRRRVLNCFELSDATAPLFASTLRRYRPDAIVAYTNALYLFAQLLHDQGIQPYSPKALIVGAEKLHPFQRQRIEDVFRAPVFETYGSREFMLIGAECNHHRGLHLTQENLIVEIVDDNGNPVFDGQEGNVAITDLTNYGMPFIRYLNGDRGVAGSADCPCGRGLPLLKAVTGRVLDVIHTPDGRHIPGELFPHLLKDFRGIRRFQVVQRHRDQLRIDVVAGADWDEAAIPKIQEAVVAICGTSIQVTVEVVNDIPLTRVGKLQVVVNQCSS
jgi:phenylacetate-CoA ligase